jgi:hypothetical protein
MPTPPVAPLQSPFFRALQTFVQSILRAIGISQDWQIYFSQLGVFLKSLGTAAFQNVAAFLQPGNNLSDVSNGQSSIRNLSGAWAGWSPGAYASGSMTISGWTVVDAEYLNLGNVTFFRIWVEFTLGGVASSVVYIGLPSNNVGQTMAVTGSALKSGSLWSPGYFTVSANSNLLVAQLDGQGNWTLGAAQVIASGFYRNN